MKETKDSSQRLNKAEKSWILYDVANSAFIMIVTATIPIYFRSLAEGSGMSGTSATSLWGSATSISILILALLSPVLGAIADYENMKKKIFTIFFVIAIAGGFLFTFAPGWLSFLIFFIIGSATPPAIFFMMLCSSMLRQMSGWTGFPPAAMHSAISAAAFPSLQDCS